AGATPQPVPGGTRRWPGTRGNAGRGRSSVRACLGPCGWKGAQGYPAGMPGSGGGRGAGKEAERRRARMAGPPAVTQRGTSVLAFLHRFALGFGLLLPHLVGHALGALGDVLGGVGLAFLVGLLHRVGGFVHGGGSRAHGGGGAGGGGFRTGSGG